MRGRQRVDRLGYAAPRRQRLDQRGYQLRQIQCVAGVRGGGEYLLPVGTPVVAGQNYPLSLPNDGTMYRGLPPVKRDLRAR